MLRRFPEILVLSLLATAGALVFVKNDEPSRPPAAQQVTAPTLPQVGPTPDPDDPRTWQTSDQVPGAIVVPPVPGQRVVRSRTMRFTYEAAPGVTVTGWDAMTGRGPVRFYITRVAWKTPGIAIDYAHGKRVRRTQPVTEMISTTPNVVAGINGDFFDISDTGAPLGLGRALDGTLWNAIDVGWNNALSMSARGLWHLGQVPLVAEVVGHPEIEITNYNSPRVKVYGTGIYDFRFGRTAGYGWTDGQRRQVRYVQIVDDKVVANTTSLPNDTPINGTVLLARGDEAEDRLRALTVGSRVKVRYQLEGEVAMAITGNAVLLKRGEVLATDDSELHPRTAIGIDRDTKELIILVVDGRQDFSRGLTMVELAKKLRNLGAEDALNLDGGGSTTLAAVRDGKLKVINSPSDGIQRPVPNGLEVTYTAPPPTE